MLLPEKDVPSSSKVAAAIIFLPRQTDSERDCWVLRVDGAHRCVSDFQSAIQIQLDILSARHFGGAVSRLAGVPAQRVCWPPALPIFSRPDPEKTEEAYRRNRRIELKLTER
ncbi:MAG: hypothetical protein QM805_13085 [Pseudomonas sp.]